MNYKFLFALFLTLGSAVLPLYAQDDFFGNVSVDLDPQSRSERDWELLGWLTEKIGYGYESPKAAFSRQDAGLNKAETSLFTQLDWRLNDRSNFRISGKAYHDFIYRLDDDTPWTRAEQRKFRNRYEVRDFYLESQITDDLYLKAGNQILAWGMAEYLRVTDVINREDQFTLGQQDLEDLRLQVPALLLGWRRGDWLLETVFTWRAGSNDIAPAGNEFDQLIALRNAPLTIDRQSPGNDAEFFLRASTHYQNGDIQFVAAEFNDNQRSFAGLKNSGGQVAVQLRQQRLQLLGAAGNYVSGSWLLFGETGIHFNRPVVPERSPVSSLALLSPEPWEERDQWLTVAGVEYNGFSNLILSLELDSRRLLNYRDTRTAARQQTSFGTRFYWTSRNERLTVLGVWNRLHEGNGYVTRLSLDYNWSDQLSLGALWVDYGARQESLLYDFRNNDVVQLQLRYSFQY